jgi:cytochrome c-type biogenesis protein CcmH
MLLWLLFAMLTAGVLAILLAPLGRAARDAPDADAGSVAVYRDQLGEIEAERARGLLDDGEAEAARIEVSRRLLATAGAAGVRKQAPLTLSLRKTMVAVAALVPLLSIGLYLAYGSPDLPSYPMAARAPSGLDQAGVGELVARVEAQLRANPEEGRGWDVVAPVYLKLGRFRDAATAYANAARLEGETVKRLLGFAEASIYAADGVVGEDARLACEKVLTIEPDRLEARVWLALAKEQDGRLAEAVADYRKLLDSAPADAPWRQAVEARIGDVSRRLARPAAPGPSAADVAAAEKLAPEDRARMIAQMVDGLAARLKRDGGDLAGWLRLVNAYVVLDRKEDARAALAEARRHFAADEQALGQLAALAKTLDLGS